MRSTPPPAPAKANERLQVVHQVRGSASMLERAANGLKADGRHPRLVALMRQKALEEDGHHDWALDDLAALGVPRSTALSAPCSAAVRGYRAWASHLEEHSPIGVLGLAFILEWLACRHAARAADNLVRARRIANIDGAVSFLAKHGEADDARIQELATTLVHLRDPNDTATVLMSARVTAALYLGLFEAATSPVS